MRPDSCSELDASSSCRTAAPVGDTPACSSQQPPDSLSSSVDHTKESDAAAPASADSKWMLRPKAVAAVTKACGRAKAKTSNRSTSPAGGAKKAKPSNKRAPTEQALKEDDERKRSRRERNKIAAAKCRNRRRELIDSLQAETDSLEDEKSALQTEIADLLREKERLEQVLASHKPSCKLPAEEEEEEAEGDAADSMMEDSPASPQLLSILESGKAPEGSVAGADANTAAILGNSDILLCSSAEDSEKEVLEDLDADDLDDLVPSLEMVASVPDIDLSDPFCLPDWETLYNSVASDLESLCTPLVSSSPACSSVRSVFSFNSSEIESKDCEGFNSDSLKDNLNSPTLLAL